MTAADLVIKNARLVDGTGAASYRGDVEVRGGVISALGRTEDGGRRVIDADGLVVAPGFIDIHTHFDAQLMFEPTASPSSWHGVTTVVTGNCGFGLAPSRPEDQSWLLALLAGVEEMNLATLEAGSTFAGGDFGDYLRQLDGRIGINVVPLVGHCSLRRLVMGAEASERAATPGEIAAMAGALDRAMEQGGFGFSSSQLDVHNDHEGKPVPSNIAAADELVALARVLARHNGSVMEFVPRTSLPGFDDADRRLVHDMAEVSGVAVNINMIDTFPGFTEGWHRNLAAAEEANREGLRVFPMFRCNPQDFYFCLADACFLFTEVPSMREALALPRPARDVALADPRRRAAIRHELATIPRSVPFEWERVAVLSASSPAARAAQGRSVTDLAADTGADVLDAVLDLALSDDLQTVFRVDRSQGPAHDRLLRRLAANPLLLTGASDAGAHLQSFCGADYPTRLLNRFVPDPLTLEQAVHKLTGQPAAMLGLTDRGTLRVGAVADLVLFDPDEVAVRSTRFVTDLPAGGRRLVHEPAGYHAVFVGGRPLLEAGRPGGELPGRVLERGGRR